MKLYSSRRPLSLALPAAFFLCAVSPLAFGQENATRAQADAAYAEQSYARALQMYRQVLAGARNETGRLEIEHRIAETLLRTQAWAEAVAQGEKLAAEGSGRARALYFLGRLHTKLPQPVWKLNGKIIAYGDGVPEVAGAAKPQQEWVDNTEKSLKYLQDAKIQAQRDRTLRKFDPLALKSDEEADLNFDLAATLASRGFGELMQTLDKRKPGQPADFDENLTLAQRFDLGWSTPKKILWLYADVRALDRSASKRDSALSLLAEGLFLRPYRGQMESWAERQDDKGKPLPNKPYPFDDRESRDSWRKLATQFPNSDLAPQALLLIAQDFQAEGDLVKARREYEQLAARYPKSKWAQDARANVQEILKRGVNLDTLGAQQPGRAAKLQYYARNVATIDFTAFPIALEKHLLKAENLKDPQVAFTQFTQNFGTIEQITRQLGAPAARWTVKTPDKADHHPVNASIDTPLSKTGAYVIVATPRGQAKLRSARLLLISDLAILEKVDRKNAFAYVANAKTGAGEGGVNVAIKENISGSNSVDAKTGRTDDAGFFDKARAQLDANGDSSVQVLAWDGARYAMTGNWSRYWPPQIPEAPIRTLAYTDRPVYRPGQTMYWRAVVTRQERGGKQTVATGRKVKVRINDARGRELLDKEFTTGEFGSVNGELLLPADVALGAFSLQLQVLAGAGQAEGYGNAMFRVEEYKRPEFVVAVDAPDTAVRAGETVAAGINAKYYFGSPVANANVKYTVRKRTWWAGYEFPSPHDWLLKTWNVSWNPWDNERRNIGGEGSGEIVAQGTAKTDSRGNAEVSFKTAAIEKDDENNWRWWWRRYSNPLYAIEVEVTDASRRTIEGAGAVKVANQEYFAFLNSPRGFNEIGDRVEIEVRTQNANDKPFAAAGKMVVYRQLPNDKEEKVYEEAVKTDAQGRLFWKWEPDIAGEFRVAWESLDAAGNKVTASTQIWINGPQLNQVGFRARGVTLVLDKRVYEEGDTLQVLVVADKPGTTVLLTQEADGEILKRDVLSIEGKSRTFSIKIGPEHVPNFAIGAAVVKDFEVLQAQAEVFVPPVRSLLNLKIAGDKASYKPGEAGVFNVSATDSAGRPARAEVSLALIDASLFYIQRDTTPDIRQTFYSERRSINVSLDSHRSGQGEARVEDLEKYEKYEQHQWSLPDGLGQLNLDPSGGYGRGYYGRRNRRGREENESMVFHGAARPMPAAAMPAPAMEAAAADMATGGAAGAAPRREVAKMSAQSNASGGPLQEAKVRSNFAETAFWSPAVVLEGGSAQVKVTFPDSLTQWHATARGLTPDAQVGAAEADTETKKNLLVRLQSPRFFVEKDQVALTANVHNYLATTKRIKVSLQTGDALRLSSTTPASTLGLSGESLSALSGFITVAPGEEKRVNWIVDAARAGDAKIRMTAQSDEDADAVEMQFPILVHGAPRFAGQTGVLRADGTKQLNLSFPKERKAGASQLNVQLNPSLAAVMLDALPYLADYPYGCVEQTTSRFVPAVIVAKTLRESGVNLQVLARRAKAYEAESKVTAPGAQVKNTGYSFPKGMPESRDLNAMASRLWYTERAKNPLFDERELNKMISEGMARLVSMQRPDGGWGWWQGSDNSDEWMSAYVAYALALAADAGVKVPTQVLDRAFAYLEKQIRDEGDIHLLTHIGHSLSMREVIKRGSVSKEAEQVLAGRLFDQRARLTTYSKSLLAMALWNIGDKEKAQVLVRNLENTIKVDATNGTAYWPVGRDWWHWWNYDNESNATALRAMLLIDPKNKLVQPIVKWLVAQSRASRWDSTRDTALAVYALADYVRINRELDVDMTLRVALNGKIARTYRVTRDNALFFDNRFISGDLFLQDGANTLSIEKKGRGNLYWSAYSEYFSLENPIKASGNGLAIKRRFFKLSRKALKQAGNVLVPVGGEGEQARQEYTRSEINDGAKLQSGDEVEVELLVDAKNDYEYVVFEDMKAGGLEPQEVRSGASYGDGLSSNVELRDDKVAFFVDRLPQGRRVLRYRMRVEIPGRFHALPTNGYAMYAPEARALSDELRVGVQDAPGESG
jgi:uncharacterized protein YfaS (alpha-2-macroglobulin family)